MEIVVRVSKDRKCFASLNWKHPERGIAGWILSFGDADEPGSDCEIAFTVFQLADLRRVLNKVDINSLVDISSPNLQSEAKTVAKPLGILVKVAEEKLPCPSYISGITGDLDGLPAVISKDEDRNCWLLSFYEYCTTAPDKGSGDYSIWVQIEFSSLQLVELRGMLNALHSQQEKEK